ncbi:MAG: hypothetical protein LBO62_06565 [Endomicrobium sp.]|jgi:hypothetical protein|nr:hypothetical protein [Endomicrobium sp.]
MAKKIALVSIPITNKIEKVKYQAVKYQVVGNSQIQYEGEAMFPISCVLANVLQQDDDVKIVLIKEEQNGGLTQKYAQDFKDEITNINSKIGAKIEFVPLERSYIETPDEHSKLLDAIAEQIDDNAQIYADISYGSKPLPFIVFNVLTFADKFLNCEIKNVVYGKYDYVNKKDHKIYDITSLYYLNSLNNTITAKNSEDARKILKSLLLL